jgi:hypothetical protein
MVCTDYLLKLYAAARSAPMMPITMNTTLAAAPVQGQMKRQTTTASKQTAKMVATKRPAGGFGLSG